MMRRCLRLGGTAALAAALAGCTTVADISGLASGGAVGAATANPAVGYAVGLGARAAVAAGLQWVSRRRQGAEQDAIAAVAGALPEGSTAPWRIRHDIPVGNEGGAVTVTRAIASPLADCREIVFSVEDPPAAPAWYASSICRQGTAWKWAAAEPAVPRWGYLQ